MANWSVYRPPIEHYEIGDAPEHPRIDPVAKVFRLVLIFVVIQALNLMVTMCLLLR